MLRGRTPKNRTSGPLRTAGRVPGWYLAAYRCEAFAGEELYDFGVAHLGYGSMARQGVRKSGSEWPRIDNRASAAPKH